MELIPGLYTEHMLSKAQASPVQLRCPSSEPPPPPLPPLKPLLSGMRLRAGPPLCLVLLCREHTCSTGSTVHSLLRATHFRLSLFPVCTQTGPRAISKGNGPGHTVAGPAPPSPGSKSFSISPSRKRMVRQGFARGPFSKISIHIIEHLKRYLS